jgi:hypothetical protein
MPLPQLIIATRLLNKTQLLFANLFWSARLVNEATHPAFIRVYTVHIYWPLGCDHCCAKENRALALASFPDTLSGVGWRKRERKSGNEASTAYALLKINVGRGIRILDDEQVI